MELDSCTTEILTQRSISYLFSIDSCVARILCKFQELFHRQCSIPDELINNRFDAKVSMKLMKFASENK